MSQAEGGSRRADSPRRRARAAAAAAEAERSAGGRATGEPWPPDDDARSAYEAGPVSYPSQQPGYPPPGYPSGGHVPPGSSPPGQASSGYSSSGPEAGGYGSANGSAPYAPGANGTGPYGSYQAPVNGAAGYQAPVNQAPVNGAAGYQAPVNGAAGYPPASNGAADYGAAGYGAADYGAQPPDGGAVASSPYLRDGGSTRSPYGGGTGTAGSPYDLPSAGRTRSPYEDVLAAAPPPVVPPPAAPPSPMNGSPISYEQGVRDLRADDSRAYESPAYDDRGNGHGSGPGQLLGGRQLEEEAWLGSSAPPRRRDTRSDRSERDDDRGPADRSSGRSGPAGPDGSTALDGLARRVGRDQRGDGSRRPEKRSSEPATPVQAAVGAVTEVVVVLGMALALSLVIKTFLVQAFFIPSESMQDTLQIGDRVLVSKLTPGPFDLHRGDVVVFKDPGAWLEPPPQLPQRPLQRALTVTLTFVGLLPQDSGEHLIKRVIGLPGDTITCCDAQGRLKVNGTPIDEAYVRTGSQPSSDPFTVTVQAGHLWVMGDHRNRSADSRYHRTINDGQVPMENVVGKAFVIVWPFSNAGGVENPPQIYARVPDAPSPGAT